MSYRHNFLVSFTVNLCISGLQSSIGEISENCDFWSKMRFFSPNIRNIFRLKLFFVHSAIEC